jgi:ketosteroid isomerase-like protein
VGVLLVLLTAGVLAWRSRASPDERAIRDRLDALRAEVNSSTKDGLGTAVRAAQIGSYFTEDAVVELGEGSVPIKGRETLMGMVARLQPRTAAFRMDLDDVTIEIVPGDTADVLLTASFVRRSISTGEESLDAREYALVMTKAAGTWQIARITAIDTFR